MTEGNSGGSAASPAIASARVYLAITSNKRWTLNVRRWTVLISLRLQTLEPEEGSGWAAKLPMIQREMYFL